MSPRQALWAVLVAGPGAGIWWFTGMWPVGVGTATLFAVAAWLVERGQSHGSSKAHSNPGDQGG